MDSFQRRSDLAIDEGIHNLDLGQLAHIAAIAGFVIQWVIAEQDKIRDFARFDTA